MTNNFEAVSNAIFHPLKSWAEQSTGNWNMLIGSGFVLLMIACILAYAFYKKIGSEDERTKQISLNSAFILLCVVILCDMIFPKEYMWQIFFLYKYSFAILAAGIYLAVRYKKDFLS
ncbi:DUF2178 domain-containing protein [Planococcus glaciei]|uniref:DUF2178 domain-containing protein n=1 Tax=Planococcus glaciei TaxID=459472 RepID=UPI001C72B380|nr:DUF2178 domain-containing protein [Planococcus glaciei]MBX0314638.1 DUF2178 domain-containing protein [Planococcus glaciei]